MIKCCVCGKEIPEFMSHNPEGAVWKKDGKIVLAEFHNHERCCEDCNQKYVIPGRVYRMKLNESKEETKAE